MALLQQLIGGKQLGAAAPPFQPGQAVGLLGGDAQPRLPMMDTIGGATDAVQELQPPIASGLGGPQAGQVQPEPEPQQGFLGDFFGTLDHNLQSPSKVIGMGLLNRIDPRLGMAGLLAGGLLGGPK